MSAGHVVKAILVLLHIEAVTCALPGPFSGSSPSGKAERRKMYISTHERAPVHSRSFPQFPPSSSLRLSSLQRVVRLIIAVMPRGVKVYTTRPLVVDESTPRTILLDHHLPLSHDVDGMERESIPLRDYDSVINRCHWEREVICTTKDFIIFLFIRAYLFSYLFLPTRIIIYYTNVK